MLGKQNRLLAQSALKFLDRHYWLTGRRHRRSFASLGQEVWSYERILGHEVTTKTLGASLVYELQSLLVARLGANFRNLIAHGLLSGEALRSETAFYLWWLLLRLIALPTPKTAEFIERRKQ